MRIGRGEVGNRFALRLVVHHLVNAAGQVAHAVALRRDLESGGDIAFNTLPELGDCASGSLRSEDAMKGDIVEAARRAQARVVTCRVVIDGT